MPRSGIVPRMPDKLDDAVIQDTKGASVRVGDLYQDKPAVLVFLRHFG